MASDREFDDEMNAALPPMVFATPTPRGEPVAWDAIRMLQDAHAKGHRALYVRDPETQGLTASVQIEDVLAVVETLRASEAELLPIADAYQHMHTRALRAEAALASHPTPAPSTRAVTEARND